LVVDRVPFVKAVVINHPLQHGFKLLPGFPFKTVLDELLNHAPPKPGPVPAVLMAIRVHARVFEAFGGVGRVQCQTNGSRSGLFDVVHYRIERGFDLRFRQQIRFDGNGLGLIESFSMMLLLKSKPEWFAGMRWKSLPIFCRSQ
jgi:hypothetical protein